MLELLFTAGQVAAAMLVLYGGVLSIGTLMPVQRKPRTLTPELEDRFVLLRHLHTDV